MVLLHNGGFATAALQNGFVLISLLFIRNQYYFQNDKNITFFIAFIFYYKVVVKQGQYIRHICLFANTPFCDATVAKSTVM
jgi:hypothetical protein